jgi:tRNA nucleotidyltransferase (CCA-adding enzyme)
MEIIASHANPDFDACAAMVAATKIYPDARAVFLGSQNRNVREYFALHGDMVDWLDVSRVDPSAVTRLIVVDTRVADRLGEMAPVAARSGVEIFCYDHHPASDEDMECTRDFSRDVGASTTILVGLLRERRIGLSVFEATLLALGIHEDTGSLTFQTTTVQDAEAVAWLMEQGASVDVLTHSLARNLSGEQADLFRQMEATGRVERINGVDILIASARVDDYVDAASVLTQRLADSMDVDVIFSLVQMKDRVHIIGRSRAPQVDAGEVLADFGGGGHPQAASAAIRGGSVDGLSAQLREALAAHVKPEITAARIMTASIRAVEPDTSVAVAGEMMRRYGHGALPVTVEGRLAGLITRRDVEKADFHGLGHAPVKGFMTRDPKTISSDTGLADIQRRLIDDGVGRLPVVEDGRVVGIVTRKDVLRAQHGRAYVADGALEGHIRTGREAIREKLTTQLPGEVLSLLGTLGALAERLGESAYVVGGIVRDLLIGEPNLDVDVVVEGDGIAFAEAIVVELGGRLRSHRKFGTAVVVLPGGFRIDVASARSEYYSKPAALPTVEPGASIRQDLGRRDFSINSMAIGLTGEDADRLVDFFGGVRDLEGKVVRVMHNLSFVEDPTRIYRAVRFEQRHGFSMDEQTERLARDAVRMGFHEKLSGPRVRAELIAILSEKDAWRAFRRLIELGAARELEPAARLDERRLAARFAAVEDALRLLDPYFRRPPKRWLAHLVSVMASVPSAEVVSWSARMRLRRADSAVLLAGVEAVPRVVKALAGRKQMPGSRLAELLDGLEQELVAQVWACGNERARQRVDYYLEHLADVRPLLTGRDLKSLGVPESPRIGEILASVREAALDGVARDRESQMALAKRLAGRAKG